MVKYVPMYAHASWGGNCLGGMDKIGREGNYTEEKVTSGKGKGMEKEGFTDTQLSTPFVIAVWFPFAPMLITPTR